MTLRVLVAAAVPLLATATAYAQAPGQWYAPPPGSAPAVLVVEEPRPASRWSIGLGVGGTELGSEEDGNKLSFSGVNIAVRYRAWQHLELELLLGGGAEDLEARDSYDLNREEYALGYGFLSARYRFNPHDKWNYWLLAGLGALTVAPKSASDDQLEAAQRAAFTFGGGIEYRLRRIAFQAELRAVAASATQDEMDYDSEATGIGGGQFTLGANLYF